MLMHLYILLSPLHPSTPPLSLSLLPPSLSLSTVAGAMKHSFHVRGFLFFLAITSMFFLHATRASLPHAAPTQGGVGLDGSEQPGPSTEMETESFWDLMGGEECDDERDEECLKRRVISEAHLDYIYTQQHHP